MISSSLSAINAVLITMLSILIYFLLLLLPQIKSLIEKFSRGQNKSFNWRMYERLSGAFILGLLPAFIMYKTATENPELSIFLTPAVNRFYLIPLSCTAILAMNFFTTRKARNRKGYPLIMNKNWNGSLILQNQLSWAVYLFGYEYLIRGVLFSSCIVLFGLNTAIIINILLYALIHFHRGIKQMVLSIPFGVVLCLLTVATSSWISAALLHIAFANSYEFFVIAHRKKKWRISTKETSTVISMHTA